jgi:hypothetical protein
MLRALAIATLLLAGACGTVATQAPPPRTFGGESDQVGLFPSDARVLPDEDIARILNAHWEVPEHVRIALLPLRRDSVFASGYYYRAAGPQTAFRAVDELRKLPFVYDVSYLPEFLLPANKTVSLVREAAARYQADWVLLYSTTVSADPEYRFFARDEVHGQCLVECALLDTRSGLIPFTARSTEEIHVKQKSSREDMSALILRAEHEAVDAAMLLNAEALVAFLGRLDRR